jgi:hypothetical protein
VFGQKAKKYEVAQQFCNIYLPQIP